MKKILIILSMAIVVAGVVFWLVHSKNNSKSPQTPEQVQSDANTNQSTMSATSATPTTGSYIDYNSEAIAQTTGTKILFFHAPWCPQCRALDASIMSGTIPKNVTIIKVDYDSNQKLRSQYGVTIQTTLVRIDDSGKLIRKYVAYDTPSLDALIQNVL